MNLLTKKEPVYHKLFASNFILSAYRMRKNEKVAVCGKIFLAAKIQSFSEFLYPSQPKYVPPQPKYDECDCFSYPNKDVNF